jgi:hypothetical protein
MIEMVMTFANWSLNELQKTSGTIGAGNQAV